MSELSRVDVEILVVLRRADGMALPPKAIKHHTADVSYSAVQSRLPVLDELGFTERLDSPRGYRRITEEGKSALLRAGEWPAPDGSSLRAK